VWVCSSVWLVKHSSYPNNKESRCRSCLSCVKPFGPFFSLNTACACCYIILIGERERERERVRWCCIGTMFSRLFKLGPREREKDLISHDSLFFLLLVPVIDYYLQVPPRRRLFSAL
jgi:hypothetical protein